MLLEQAGVITGENLGQSMAPVQATVERDALGATYVRGPDLTVMITRTGAVWINRHDSEEWESLK